MSVVSAIIEQEIAQIGRLIETLTLEQESLKTGDANALPEICAGKNSLVAAMNQLEAERMQAIGQEVTANDRLNMTRWLADNASDTDATVNWKKLLKLASDAKALHEVNGSLIDLHLRNTTDALAILTQHPESPTLYGASGQTMPNTGSRIVDSA